MSIPRRPNFMKSTHAPQPGNGGPATGSATDATAPERGGDATESAKALERTGAGPRPIRLKIFGVGGAGGNVVNHIASAGSDGSRGLDGIDLAAINTDAQALGAVNVSEKIQIGEALTHGLSAGGDVELGARSAQQDCERLAVAVQHVDVAFLAVGFGGGTGTGAGPIVARLAKEQGALVLVFAVMPFGFEGQRRQQQARAGLDQLKMHADVVICLPNDKLAKFVGEQGSVVEAFQRSDELIGCGAKAIWQLLSRKGLINLDFADLRATLGAKHCDGVFSYGVAAGPDKAREAVKALLDHPLFDGGETLAKADGILVSILGGPDLSLADVQKTVEPITRQAGRARVIMGAAIDESYRDRLAVTVIAGLNSAARRSPLAISSRPVAASPTQGRGTRPQPMATSVAGTKPISAPVAAEKEPAKPKQETLPLDTVSRGRFEKSEPTLYDGEDLDVPTYLRRGVSLRK